MSTSRNGGRMRRGMLRSTRAGIAAALRSMCNLYAMTPAANRAVRHGRQWGVPEGRAGAVQAALLGATQSK